MEIPAIGGVYRNSSYPGYAGRAVPAQEAPAPARPEDGALPQDPSGLMNPVRGAESAQGGGGLSEATKEPTECQTCKNRKYQDGSDDPGVSYKNPTAIDPDVAGSAVRGHEMEHVTRERFKAAQSGRKVVSQSVSIHTAICPECGRVYVSGGTTRTVTKGKEEAQLFRAGMPDDSGKQLDAKV